MNNTVTNTRIYNLALALVGLNGIDLVITHTILQANKGHEGNPLMAFIVGNLWLFVTVKIGYPAWLGWVQVRRARVEYVRWRVPALAGIVVLMVGVCTWNFYLLTVRS